MTDLDAIELRRPTDDDFAQFLQTLSTAFGETVSDDEIAMERATAELDRMYGAWEGSTMVGTSGSYTFRLTTPGGEVGAAGVAFIGVLPTHIRRGILRTMMTRLFADADERGEPVAILWASEAAIYQRFGYGMGTTHTVMEADRGKIRFLAPAPTGGRVRIVDADEAATIFPPIYETHRAVRPGSLTRTDAKWRTQLVADQSSMRANFGHKVNAVYEVDGRARGYVIYRHKSEWDVTGPKGTVLVFELLGLDAEAEQALWHWMFGIDLVSTVRVWRGPVPHPLQSMVTEPRRLGITLNDAMWLRILDVARALSGRTYRGPGRLVLDVSDELRPSNAGRWQLTVPSPGARGVVERTTAEPDLALDISALASTYLGAFRFAELARAARVRECHPGAIATADDLFAVPSSPWNSTMF